MDRVISSPFRHRWWQVLEWVLRLSYLLCTSRRVKVKAKWVGNGPKLLITGWLKHWWRLRYRILRSCVVCSQRRLKRWRRRRVSSQRTGEHLIKDELFKSWGLLIAPLMLRFCKFKKALLRYALLIECCFEFGCWSNSHTISGNFCVPSALGSLWLSSQVVLIKSDLSLRGTVPLVVGCVSRLKKWRVIVRGARALLQQVKILLLLLFVVVERTGRLLVLPVVLIEVSWRSTASVTHGFVVLVTNKVRFFKVFK